jgi:hypothetical protein
MSKVTRRGLNHRPREAPGTSILDAGDSPLTRTATLGD